MLPLVRGQTKLAGVYLEKILLLEHLCSRLKTWGGAKVHNQEQELITRTREKLAFCFELNVGFVLARMAPYKLTLKIEIANEIDGFTFSRDKVMAVKLDAMWSWRQS